MTSPTGYRQLPSGFWVRDDGSGPYFVDVAAGTATPIGDGGGGGGGSSYLGAVASTTALTGLTDGVLGSTADVGASEAAYVLYELRAEPYSVEANWQALQGVMSTGSVYTVELVEGKLPRRVWVYVPTGNQVTVTVGGSTLPVLVSANNPHFIDIYDIPGVTAPTSITFQRTSGSDATGWFSVEG